MSKSYYNQPDYSSEEPLMQKPNEVSGSDSLPPPPYSPATSSSRQYDAARDSLEQPQEQVGLLSQHNTTFPKRSINPHLDFPEEEGGSSSSQLRRRNDPGLCKRWCKYIFLALLLSLVIYKVGGKLVFSSPINGTCPNGMTWESMPSTIEFSQNIEFIMEGSATSGQVIVVPLEDRHGGSISSNVQVFPETLQDDMSYRVEEGDTTRVYVTFPATLQDDECVNARIEINLPYAADLVRVQVNNMDVTVHPFVKDVEVLDIKTSNADIVLDHWIGDQVNLVTNQGDIKTSALSAKDHVYLENENGDIIVNDNVIAKKTITVKSSNGVVALIGRTEADDSVDIESSNGDMQVSNVLADRVFIQNGNGKVQVDAVEAKEQITVKSSNAPVDVSVVGEKNNRVTVMNANAEINLHMTHEFEGRFVMSTSQGTVEISDDADEIQYQDDLDYLKRGYRRGYGKKGDLTVQTSNSNVHVSFDF